MRALVFVALAACGPAGASIDDTDPVDTSDTDSDTSPPAPADFRERGPYTVTAEDDGLAVTSGCTLDYTLFTPSSGDGPLVILTHGFMRTKDQMAVFAEHLASWGFVVATPTTCTRTFLDIDQERNGRDLAELGAALGGGASYVGHSAGGLASIVAAAEDPDTVALFGLDPVEAEGIAAGIAADLPVPLHAAIGFDAACNAQGSMVPVYAAMPEGTRAVEVTDADHCDFESPTDWVCTTPCGQGPTDTFDDAAIQSTIVLLMTADLAWRTGLDPAGESWWTGDGYATLAAEGRVSERAP